MPELALASICERGPRAENQDAAAWAERPGAVLLFVADGLGGLPHGAYASQRVKAQLCNAFLEAAAPAQAPARWLEENALKANQALLNQGHADPAYAGTSTTLSAALLTDRALWTINIGDSRIQRSSPSLQELTCLTREHSLVGEAVAAGELSEDAAFSHAQRHIVTSCLGMPPAELQIDLREHPPLQPGEWLLCTTDGIHDLLRPKDILRAMAAAPSGPAALLSRLARAVEAAGPRDNFSAVLAQRPDKQRGTYGER